VDIAVDDGSAPYLFEVDDIVISDADGNLMEMETIVAIEV